MLLSKLQDNIKQYGMLIAFKQVFMRFFVKFYYVNRQYIFKLRFNDGTLTTTIDPNINILDGSENEQYLPFIKRGLTQDEIAFVYQTEGVIKGYALIQKSGRYPFSRGASFYLEEDMFMLKNLFVYSAFRGERIGLKLNQARVSYALQRPNVLVLVLKENKTAIKNIEKVGFEKVALFSLKVFLNMITRTKIYSTKVEEPIVARLKGYTRGA